LTSPSRRVASRFKSPRSDSNRVRATFVARRRPSTRRDRARRGGKRLARVRAVDRARVASRASPCVARGVPRSTMGRVIWSVWCAPVASRTAPLVDRARSRARQTVAARTTRARARTTARCERGEEFVRIESRHRRDARRRRATGTTA